MQTDKNVKSLYLKSKIKGKYNISVLLSFNIYIVLFAFINNYIFVLNTKYLYNYVNMIKHQQHR